jgi:hypothetical protein
MEATIPSLVGGSYESMRAAAGTVLRAQSDRRCAGCRRPAAWVWDARRDVGDVLGP